MIHWKGSLTSIRRAAIEKGIKSRFKAEVVIKPLADGGEDARCPRMFMEKAPIGEVKLRRNMEIVNWDSQAVTKVQLLQWSRIDAYFPIVDLRYHWRCYEEEKCTGEFDRYGRSRSRG